MRKFSILVLTGFLLVGTVSAQQVRQVRCPSNLVGPGLGPLWQADKAVDSLTKGPGGQAAERAAEACNALKQNETDQAEIAIQEHNRIAEVATNQSTRGLEKAERVLEAVRDRMPEEANQAGINNALDAIEDAKDRRPKDLRDIGGRPDDAGPSNRDRGVPYLPGSRFR